MYGRKVTIHVDELALRLMVDALISEGERRKKLQLVARDLMDRDGWALRRVEGRTISFTVGHLLSTIACLPDDHGAMTDQVQADVLRNRNAIPRSAANEERWAEMVTAWKRQEKPPRT